MIDLFKNYLRPRQKNSHKGHFGNVGILGGAPGMTGAALLAGRAALKLGAGRVYVGMIERLPVDLLQPELMLRETNEIFELATVLAIGPGLGCSKTAHELLYRAIESSLPLVIDADGLNHLAEHPVLMHKIVRRTDPTILTPHPLEAARLLRTDVTTVQANRVAAALKLTQISHAHIALKGHDTLIASPDGQWITNTTGNPGLATAGSGDVLTGVIIALLAQGWPPREALLCAVHLHGAAADKLVSEGIGPIGLTAGELIDTARLLFNQWTLKS